MNVSLDGSACGPTPHDLCNYRCMAGQCDHTPTVCEKDNNLGDCSIPTCDSNTGLCPYIALNDSVGCSDGNACTENDQCLSGVCVGKPKECDSPDQCHKSSCQFGTCVPYPLDNISCNADDNECTVGDYCAAGTCIAGVETQCNSTEQCTSGYCSPDDGNCYIVAIPDYVNQTCDDSNICTMNDVCYNGTCRGDKDPSLANLTLCGFIAPPPKKTFPTTAVAVAVAISGVTLIGAVAGLAALIKKVKAAQLLNPTTWNPDSFTSVGSNPLYQGSAKTVDNQLYEGAAP